MAITFNTNLAALGAQRNIGIASGAASSSLSKLSSGSRVPQAKDDAAGLAIGSKLKSEVAGLTQASNNAAQAISLLQIADGALSTLGDILQRMKSLAVQSSSGQLDDASRSLLNQEFTNIQSEVDRVSAVTNFNGTTLLAGSTTVASQKTNLAAYTGNNQTSVNSALGAGIDNFDFSDAFGDGTVKVSYEATGRLLTVENLANNSFQTIALNNTTLTAGQTETYNFSDIGVKLDINSQFNKAADIAASNVAHTTPAAAGFALTNSAPDLGLTGGTSIVFSISARSFTGTGANAFFGDQLFAQNLTVSGAVATVSLANLVIGSHTFVNTTGANTLAAAGTDTWNFDDGQGNTFTVQAVTTGTYTGTASGTVAIAAGLTGTIQNGTGAAQSKIVGAVSAGTTPFNFATVDNPRVTVTATTASASVLSVDLGSVVFTSAGVDLTSTGVKTVTLTGVGAGNTSNTLTVQFNVTKAFANGDAGVIDLGELGQLVAADSVTSGTTTFNFKVGTGTTNDDRIQFSLNSATTTALGIASATIDTAANSDTAIGLVNTAITAVASRRADIGAAQSRLDFAANSISVAIENTTAAASALLDVDVSAEITKFTNQNVLMQAGISLLGQANQQPALLLRLLQ